MNFNIETERLILRDFSLLDSTEYFEITRDEAICQYVPFACYQTIEETSKNIQKYYMKGDFIHDYYLVIQEKETNKIIGAIINTQNSLSPKYFDCSYFLAKSHRGKGFMKEALEAFLKHISNNPGKAVLFNILTENISSQNMITKINGVKLPPNGGPFSGTYTYVYRL